MNTNEHLNNLYFPLRLCYGLVPVVAGADKFTNLLTDWSQYLPEALSGMLPFEAGVFMMIVGVIEIDEVCSIGWLCRDGLAASDRGQCGGCGVSRHRGS